MRRSKRDQDGIYQRPDSPYWWASIPDGCGGSARRSTGIRRADDPQGKRARAIRAGWIAECPPPPPRDRRTFDDLLVLYLERVSPTKRAPERDRWSARRLFPVFTGRDLAGITGADVRAYIADRASAGASAGTINREIGLASAAWSWARKELDWMLDNPWTARRLTEPAGRGRWLTRAEAQALLAAAHASSSRAPWLEDFVRLVLHTGLRSGEALGLEWTRVDLHAGQILLREEDQKSGRRSVVPLNAQARDALLSRARYRAARCPGSPWVFCRADGSRLASIKKGFAAAVARAGLSDVHPHDLRRTCGSWLVQAGIGIERVSALLRHSDVSVTARVYAHLRPSDLAQAIAALDGLATDSTTGSINTVKRNSR